MNSEKDYENFRNTFDRNTFEDSTFSLRAIIERLEAENQSFRDQLSGVREVVQKLEKESYDKSLKIDNLMASLNSESLRSGKLAEELSKEQLVSKGLDRDAQFWFDALSEEELAHDRTKEALKAEKDAREMVIKDYRRVAKHMESQAIELAYFDAFGGDEE